MSNLIRFLAFAVAFFTIAGLLVVFGVFDRCSRRASEAAIAEEINDISPTFKMSSSELVEAYLEDEEWAKSTYDGQVGIVEAASLGFVDESNHFQFFGNGIWKVRCFVSDAEADKVWSMRNSFRTTNVYQRDRSGVTVGSASLFSMKGRVEGVNDKHLSIDIHGCIVQDSP